MRLRSEDKHHLRKSADRKAQIRKAFVPLTGLICAFRSADFLRWCLSSERNLTHNLFFYFPAIVFGINLIHFFDEKKDGAAGNSVVCFGASIPCHAIWQKQNEELFRRAQRFWQRKEWTQRPSRGEKLRCKFLARKVQNSLPILRWKFLARKGEKFIANFSATKVTSPPSHSLSLSLSLCISLSHRAHLTHNIGSASALPIIIRLDNDFPTTVYTCKSNENEATVLSGGSSRSVANDRFLPVRTLTSFSQP